MVQYEYEKGYAQIRHGGNYYYPTEGELTNRLSEGWSHAQFRFIEDDMDLVEGDLATIDFVRPGYQYALFKGEVTEISNITEGKERYFEVMFDGEGRKLDWRIAQLPSSTMAEHEYIATIMSYVSGLIGYSTTDSLTNPVSPSRGGSGRRMVWEALTQFCKDKTIDFMIDDMKGTVYFFHSPIGTISGSFDPILVRDRTDSIKKLKTRITLYNESNLVNEHYDWWSESTLYIKCFTADTPAGPIDQDGTVMLLTDLDNRPDYCRDYSVVARGTTDNNFQVWVGITPDSIIPAVRTFNYSYIPVMSKHYKIGIGDQDKMYFNVYLSSSVCPDGSLPVDNYLKAKRGPITCLSAGPHDKLSSITTGGWKTEHLNIYEDFETVGTWSGSIAQAIIQLTSTFYTYFGGSDEFYVQPVKQAGIFIDGIYFENVISYTYSVAGSESSYDIREYLPSDELYTGNLETGSITAKSRLGDLWKPEEALRDVVIEGTQSATVGYEATFNSGGTAETYLIQEVTHEFDGDDWRTRLICSSSKAHHESSDRAIKIRNLGYAVRQLEHFANDVAGDTDILRKQMTAVAFAPVFPQPSDILGGTIKAEDLIFNGTIVSIGNIGTIGTIDNFSVGSITSIGTIGNIGYMENLSVGSIEVIGTADISYAIIDDINVIGIATIGIANVDNIGTINTLSAGILVAGDVTVTEISNVEIMSIASATINTLNLTSQIVGNQVVVSNNIADLAITAGKIGNNAVVAENLYISYPEDNMIHNYSFEIDSNNDNLPDELTISFSYGSLATWGLSSEAFSGSQGVAVTFPTNGEYLYLDTSYSIPVCEYEQFFAKVYAKANVTTSCAAVGMKCYDAGGTLVGGLFSNKFNLTTSWQAFQMRHTVDAATRYIVPSLYIYNPTVYPCTVYFDDFICRRVIMSGLQIAKDVTIDVSGATITNMQIAGIIQGANMDFTNATIDNLNMAGGSITNVSFGSINNLAITGCTIDSVTIGAITGDNIILASHIDNGAITAGKIASGAVESDKITANWITGKSFRTADSGSRIEFNAQGIRGYSIETTMFSISALDGKMYCGNGSVVLSNLGIGLNGISLFLFDSVPNPKGALNANSSFVNLDSSVSIYIRANSLIAFNTNSKTVQLEQCNLVPQYANQSSVGTASKYFMDGYFNTIHYLAADSGFDDYDDLEMARYLTYKDKNNKSKIDLKSLSFLMDDNDFISANKMNNFLLGCAKQTAEKLEAIDKRLKQLEDEKVNK